MKKKLLILVMALIMAMSTIACSSKSGGSTDDNSPIYVGSPSVLSGTDPTEGSSGWSLISYGVAEGVYKLDIDGNLVSRTVKEIEQVDDNNWNVVLNEDVSFSDGSNVDAEAFCACMNEIIEKNEMSRGTLGVMKFEKTGDYTLSINTEKVTKTMPSVLAEWTRVLYKKDDAGNYLFTGPYVIKELEKGIQITLAPNEYYPNAEKRSEVIVKAFEDTSAMKLAFEGGEIDMAFNLPVDVANMLADEGKQLQEFAAGYQYFTYVNLEDEILSDLKVRQAINLILDREEMLSSINGGKVANGMFATYYSFAGKSEVKTDVAVAEKLLDEAGWTLNSDGVREKDGKVLELNLVTYASRPDLPILMQVAASQLDKVGIKTKTSMSDNITETASKGEYDLMFYAQFTAPYGEPLFFLNQAFRSDLSTNYTRYKSAKVDSLLDKMSNLPLGDERDAVAVEVQDELFKDLPVIYLVDPMWKSAVSEKLSNYQLYGGDYYMINDTLGVE